MKYWPAKPPADIADYLFRFVDDLESGETIVSKTVTPAGVTKVSDAIVDVVDETTAGTVTTTAAGVRVWLSGGTFGTNAKVDCVVVTSGGRTYSATAVLLIGEEPVSLAQAKERIRIFHDDEDAQIARMITRARLWVEDHTGIALVRRQLTEPYVPEYGEIRLYKKPVLSVDSVAYVDTAGVSQSYTPTYDLGTATLYPVTGEYWPTLGRNRKFAVTYTAGLTPDQIDDRLIGAMYALIEGEYSSGFAYSRDATDAAERCCGQLRPTVV